MTAAAAAVCKEVLVVVVAVAEEEREEEDWSYRISNGAGMKRFLIFRLAAFQWAGALHAAQALIPAAGSIIGVSSGSPRPRKPTEGGCMCGRAGGHGRMREVFFFSTMPVWMKGEIAGYSP